MKVSLCFFMSVFLLATTTFSVQASERLTPNEKFLELVNKKKLTNKEVTDSLKKKKVNINTQDINDYTLLALLIDKIDPTNEKEFIKRKEIVKFLINYEKKPPDLNLKTKGNKTLLMLALMKHLLDIAELLINKNVELNVQNNNKNTAFIIAIRELIKIKDETQLKKFINIINILVKEGADVSFKNNKGDSAFTYANKITNKETKKKILELLYELLFEAVKDGNLDVVKKILAAGANINVQDSEGYTPFAWAIENTSTKNYEKRKGLITFLMKYQGVDINKANLLKQTPIMLAIKKLIKESSEKNVKELIEIIDWSVYSKADLLLKNNKGESAFNLANKIVDVETKKKVLKLLHEPLFEAVEYGKVGIVIKMLAAGANINEQNLKGYTPFAWAIHNTSPENYKKRQGLIMSLMKYQGVDINKANLLNKTPLMLAIKNKLSVIAKNIINNIIGADQLNIQDKNKRTALMYAILQDQYDVADKIIKKGLYVDKKLQDENGNTVIMLAIKKLTKEISEKNVKELIDIIDWFAYENLDLSVKNKEGKSAFTYANKITNEETKKKILLLLNEPFFKAVKNGKVDTVKKMIEVGTDPALKDNKGDSAFNLANEIINVETKKKVLVLLHEPLFKAVKSVNVDTIQKILAAGANINVQDIITKDTILIDTIKLLPKVYKDIKSFLIFGGNTKRKEQWEKESEELIKIVELLIEKGVDVSVKNKEGKSAFTYANKISYVAKKESSQSLKNFSTNTVKTEKKILLLLHEPFFKAVKARKVDTIQKMIEAGANPALKDEEGKSAFTYANKIINEETKKKILLLLNEPFFKAVKDGKVDTVKKMIEVGSDINAQDSYGKTPLMVAIDAKQNELAKWIINNNPDFTKQDKNGFTALLNAIESRDREIIDTLIAKKGGINIQDKEGLSPLMYAVMNEDVDTIKNLIKAGANKELKDKLDKKTALDYAKDIENENIKEQILEIIGELRAPILSLLPGQQTLINSLQNLTQELGALAGRISTSK